MHHVKRWALVVVLVGLIAPAVGQRGDRDPVDESEPLESWDIPESPVRTAEETMATFELPPGFRVELVAAEPLLHDPIAIDFGLDGRLWVVELPSYNWDYREHLPGYESEPPPPGRVVVLEDTNGDGQMDQRTVFLDDLENPRSVTLVGDGVLVTDSPRVYYCRDTTGDGKADEKTVVLEDFGQNANPHASPNLLFRAMDNWHYGVAWPARLRWVDGRFERDEPIVPRGQWGMTQDNFGRLYYGRNTDPARGDVMPPAYWRANPNHGEPAGINVRFGHDLTVWPHDVTPGVNRRNHLRDDGTLRSFTANAGLNLYRGDQFPKDFYGDLFVPEPAANLIRRYRLSERDGEITAENAYDQREFLFSHDERFRPVSLSTAPDGSIYVVDMYRGIIEGHLFITTFLRNQIVDRDLHQPFEGLGRIYRIVHEEGPANTAVPPMHEQDASELVAHLNHPNGWWRDTAQRVLVERRDEGAVPALRQLAGHADQPATRVQALWTLEGIDALAAGTVKRALADESHHVRMAGLRLSADFLDDAATRDAVVALADDERIEVRRLVLLALGESGDERAERVMAEVLHGDLERPFVIDAAMSGLAGRELRFLHRLSTDDVWKEQTPARSRLFQVLAAAVVREGDGERIVRLLSLAGDSSGRPVWMREALLDGVMVGAEKQLAVEPEAFGPALSSQAEGIRERALRIMNERLGEEMMQPEPTEGLSKEDLQRLEIGRAHYAICSACHGPQGQGIADVAPSLADSERVAGSDQALARIVLHGLESNADYPAMTPLPGLDDESIAAVLTYLRRSWGHRAGPVDPASIKEVRKQTRDRHAPWTGEELDAFRE